MNTHLTQSNTTWKSSICVFFTVEVKVFAGSLVLRAVSKGLNAPDLTFDPVGPGQEGTCYSYSVGPGIYGSKPTRVRGIILVKSI